MSEYKRELTDFLDAFITMEGMLGAEWEYFHKSEEQNLVQYFLETEKKEVNITLHKGKGIIFLELYIDLWDWKKHIDEMKEWAKQNAIRLDGKKRGKQLLLNEDRKIGFGVENLTKLEEFIKKFFTKSN